MYNGCRRELERAQHQSRQFTARMASSNLMIQNAEAASAQQTAAAAAAEHKADKLDLRLADTQWELEQCQRQLKDRTAQTESQMKVHAHAACVQHQQILQKLMLAAVSCMFCYNHGVLQLCLSAM